MRTQIIYHDCGQLEQLQSQLEAKSRFGGAAISHTRRDFLLALQAAVAKSDVIVAVGQLFGAGKLAETVAKATGHASEQVVLSSLGLSVDAEVALPHSALPLIDGHSNVSGFILECGKQSIIAIEPTADDLIEAYIIPYVAAKKGAAPKPQPAAEPAEEVLTPPPAPPEKKAEKPERPPQFDEVTFGFEEEEGEYLLDLPEKRHPLRTALIVLVALVVAAAGAFAGYRYIYEPSACRSIYSEARGLVGKEGEGLPSNALSKFGALYEKNSGLFGWISIAGTSVDYPVMSVTKGEQYYENHLYDGTYSSYGTPYTSGRYDATGYSTNLIIRGNNRGDGLMFSDLDKLADADYLREHNTVKMSSIYYGDDWAIVSVMRLEKNEVNARFDEANFENSPYVSSDFVEYIKSKSLVDCQVEAHTYDYYLTLIAPSRQEAGKDVVVVARKILAGESSDDTEQEDPFLSESSTVDLLTQSSVSSNEN